MVPGLSDSSGDDEEHAVAPSLAAKVPRGRSSKDDRPRLVVKGLNDSSDESCGATGPGVDSARVDAGV